MDKNKTHDAPYGKLYFKAFCMFCILLRIPVKLKNKHNITQQNMKFITVPWNEPRPFCDNSANNGTPQLNTNSQITDLLIIDF